MKIIAYFLPQFHEVEENNLWWGQGFTEWTNIRNAKSYNKKHSVLTPYQENYYNLLDEETLKWQGELAKKYGVYGFCYYHYWFSGRKILEKPADLLFKNPAINQKYCFCWANHSWKKTWNGTHEILIEQTYGDEQEWKEHLDYLMPFFKDSRYILKDNKPLLMLFDAENIPNLDQRIEFYNNECKKNGFNGIYIIETINKFSKKPCSTLSDAITLREPAVAFSRFSKLKKVEHRIRGNRKNRILPPTKYTFEKVINNSLEAIKQYECDKEIILGSFTGWDSTPRHKNRGYWISNNSAKKFGDYLQEQKKVLSSNKYSEFLFMNAWNEWAEGMVLEPTKQNGYSYLEMIKKTVN